MQPQNQTNTVPSNAYMQSRVQYFGKTMFGGGLGLLEWNSDSHIRLFKIDPASGQSTGIIFDCLPNQIQKVRASLTNLTFYLDGKRYNMDLSTGALPWLVGGGVFGIFMASRKTQQSGIQWWVDNLRTQGLTVKQLNIWKIFKLTFFITFGFIILIIIIAILAGGSK